MLIVVECTPDKVFFIFLKEVDADKTASWKLPDFNAGLHSNSICDHQRLFTLLTVLKFSFTERGMSDGYLTKRILDLNQLPLE